MGPRPTNQMFFRDVVLNHDSDDCLIWPFSKTPVKGYPRMFFKVKNELVTRLVCEHFYGPAPTSGRQCQSAHSCRNASCVNWRHLRWATPKENESDKLVHGTHQHGERNHMAKLTRGQVQAIREAQGSSSQVAQRYGVNPGTIRKIRRGERWTFA